MFNSLHAPPTFNNLQNLSTCLDMHRRFDCKYHNRIEATVSNKKEDWSYTLNQYGYRGNWDLETINTRVGYFGCSNTFGIGVKDKDTFVEQLATNHTKMSHFNFGQPGASMMRVLKTFIIASQLSKLDCAVVSLPSPSRQLHIIRDGYYDFNISHVPDDVPAKYYKAFSRIRTLENVKEEGIMIIDTMILWANALGVKLFFNCWDSDFNDVMIDLYDNDYLFQPILMLDKGRDSSHPGPESHNNYAECISEKIGLINV